MLDDDFNDFFDSDDDAIFVEASKTFSDCNTPSPEILLTSEKQIPKNQEITVSSSYFDIKKNKFSVLQNQKEPDTCISNISESSKRGVKYVISTSVVPDSSNVESTGNKNNFKHDTIVSASNSSNITANAKNNEYITDTISTEFNTKDIFLKAIKNNLESGTISILSKSSKVIPEENNNFAPDTALETKSCSVAFSVNEDCFTSSIISASSCSSNVSSIVDKNSFTPDTSVRFDSKNVTSNLKKSTFTPNTSSYINNRFTPGFTPKAKKRKFVGPAGLLELFDESNKEMSYICESKETSSTMDNEFEHIVSSQFSPENLSLLSWQKLQNDVSSHATLHSAAKFYSIQRVLHESSKKKLPKHIVVPVLCVLLKEIKHKGSSIIPVFMDDTGEINGKIDAEVTSKFKDYIIEGSALILKRVTFLCNILILKTDNLVSMYCPDGTENRLQSLESVLDATTPLKAMNCECLKQSHQNKNSPIYTVSSRNGITDPHKVSCVDHSLKLSNKALNEKSINREVFTVKSSSSASKLSPPVKNMRNDAFLEDLLSTDNFIDEFDELLGNLDEESFLGDL